MIELSKKLKEYRLYNHPESSFDELGDVKRFDTR